MDVSGTCVTLQRYDGARPPAQYCGVAMPLSEPEVRPHTPSDLAMLRRCPGTKSR